MTLLHSTSEKDHSNSSINYQILDEALLTSKQYFLISCTNAFSVYSERESFTVEVATPAHTATIFQSHPTTVHSECARN